MFGLSPQIGFMGMGDIMSYPQRMQSLVSDLNSGWNDFTHATGRTLMAAGQGITYIGSDAAGGIMDVGRFGLRHLGDATGWYHLEARETSFQESWNQAATWMEAQNDYERAVIYGTKFVVETAALTVATGGAGAGLSIAARAAHIGIAAAPTAFSTYGTMQMVENANNSRAGDTRRRSNDTEIIAPQAPASTSTDTQTTHTRMDTPRTETTPTEQTNTIQSRMTNIANVAWAPIAAIGAAGAIFSSNNIIRFMTAAVGAIALGYGLYSMKTANIEPETTIIAVTESDTTTSTRDDFDTSGAAFVQTTETREGSLSAELDSNNTTGVAHQSGIGRRIMVEAGIASPQPPSPQRVEEHQHGLG